MFQTTKKYIYIVKCPLSLPSMPNLCHAATWPFYMCPPSFPDVPGSCEFGGESPGGEMLIYADFIGNDNPVY